MIKSILSDEIVLFELAHQILKTIPPDNPEYNMSFSYKFDKFHRTEKGSRSITFFFNHPNFPKSEARATYDYTEFIMVPLDREPNPNHGKEKSIDDAIEYLSDLFLNDEVYLKKEA